MAKTKGWGCAVRGKTKKYASGGYVGAAGTNRGSWSGDGESLGITTGTKTGTSATNRAEASDTDGMGFKNITLPKRTVKAAPPAAKPPVPKQRPAAPISGPWPGQSNIPTTRTAPGKGDLMKAGKDPASWVGNGAPGKGDREATSNAAPGKTDRER